MTFLFEVNESEDLKMIAQKLKSILLEIFPTPCQGFAGNAFAVLKAIVIKEALRL
jgi:hypothetical protein